MELLTKVCLLLVAVAGTVNCAITDECLYCMCEASSGCMMPDPPCTQQSWGLVCSPWGFTEPYWIDGGREGASFEECGSEWGCSELTVRNYLARWVTSSSATCETYARTHAGGPNGASQDYTLEYWYTVEDCLNALGNSPAPTYPPLV